MQTNRFDWLKTSLVLSPLLFLAACGGGGSGGGDDSPVDLIDCLGAVNMTMGETTELSCSATEGTTLDSVSWVVASKPETSGLSMLDGTLTPLFEPDKNGTYSFTVTAVSGTDQQTASVQVTVGNVAPAVNCSSQTARKDENVTLSCDISDPGEVNPSFTYTWEIFQAPTSDTLSSMDTAQTSLTPTARGDYTIKLTVSDGELAASDTFKLVVIGGVVKILPVGDSITQADINHNSYRYELFKLLIDAGHVPGEDFDLIGSQPSNDGGDPPGLQVDYNGYAFDKDNEGHWGQRADMVLGYLNGYAPDIALVHLGTNDVKDGETNAQIVQDLQNVVNRLQQLNPNVQIYLALLIPAQNAGFPNLTPANISALNTAIQNSNLAEPPNVTLVDQNDGYTVADNFDGIHPNPTGEGKVAQKWFDAIKENL